MNNHLTPQQMLAYIDGELSKSETRRAEDHLHSCWTCLTEVERLKTDIAVILDAQNEYFSPALPPAPRPWPTFEALLARSLPARPISGWSRFWGTLNAFLTPTRLVMVSTFIAVVLVYGYVAFHAKPVSAKEVLRRVNVADAQRSNIRKDQVIREQVHIRKFTRSHEHSEDASIYAWKSPTAAYWSDSQGDNAAANLNAHYQAHDIPDGLPLSAAALDAWGRLAGGDPVISRQGSDLDVTYSSASSDASSSLERVSLSVQPDTWQVKQLTLDFADSTFEVSDEGYTVMPTAEVPSDVLAFLEPQPLPGAAPVRVVSDAGSNMIRLPMVNLDTAELKVFSTLHKLHADLGDPVSVSRSGQSVQVGLWALPSDRQEELRSALENQPGIELLLAPPRSFLRRSAETPQPQPAMDRSTPLHIDEPPPDDDQRLLKFFGSSDREQDFTNQALASSTAILSHLYALRNLQGQFPMTKDQRLASEGRAELHTLVQDHVTAASVGLEGIGRQLAPLDSNFSVHPCVVSTTPPSGSWQEESMKAFQTARTIDHLLRAMLTTSQAPAAPDAALPAIDSNLCQLRAELSSLNGMAR